MCRSCNDALQLRNVLPNLQGQLITCFLGQRRLHLLYAEVMGLPSRIITRCLDGQLFLKKLETLLLWFSPAETVAFEGGFGQLWYNS